MADDITVNSGSGGPVVGADEISSVYYQRCKLISGADGTNAGDVSVTAPLPVSTYGQSEKVFVGINSCTPIFVKVAIAAADTTIVTAKTGKIRVLAMFLVGETGDGTVIFNSGASGTALTGTMPLNDCSADGAAAQGQILLPYNPMGWFETVAATLLEMECDTVRPQGFLTYIDTAEV